MYPCFLRLEIALLSTFFIAAAAGSSFAQALPVMPDPPRQDGDYVIQGTKNFERGRMIFKGKADEYPGLEVCLKLPADNLNGWAAVPVSRDNIKLFRRKRIEDLVVRLFDCKSPDVLIGRRLEKEDFQELVRFINHRFRLTLKK